MTPQRHPCSRASAAQWASRPQPMRSSGKGSSVGKVARANAVTGPISTKLVSRTTLQRAPPRLRPRGMRVQAVGGLGELQREALAQEQEAVEEAARQLDVVVDHEQPVATLGRVGGEQPVEVLELPPSRRAEQVCSSTSWRERSSSARIAARGSRCSGRSTPSTSTRRRGGSVTRRELEEQAPAARQLPGVHAARPPRRGAAASSPPTVPLVPERKSLAGASSRLRCPARRRPPSDRSFAQALPQAAGAVRDHRQSGGAAAADDVSQAPGERAAARVRARAPARGGRRSGGRLARARRRCAPVSRRRASRAARRWSTAARATYRTRPRSAARRAPERRRRRARRRTGGPATPARPRRARARRRTVPTRSRALRRIAMLAPQAYRARCPARPGQAR